MELHIYTSVKLGSCVRETQEENFFVCFLGMFISHSSSKESGVITRQSLSREWGEKMAVCRTLGRKLFDHVLMRKLLEAGKFFVSISFL
jgi:hypothetical protein